MAFGDLSGVAGLKKLNDHLKTRSYIDGYSPSQSDTAVFEQIKSSPSSSEYVHVLRWYNHIKSFGDLKNKFPGDVAKKAAAAADDDDDVDLFVSDDEEDAEAAKVKEQRLAEYAEKKQKKGPGPIAKSSVILDVKPWDDETDMKEMERLVRSISMDGLVWGVSKLVEVGYGIKKLQIICVVEDDKISIEQLTEDIQNFEDLVQSVDIAAFNKI
ncbi:probable elongation factor 1-beta [Folsomia candida]|uniref:probable elongation factor 1-beta n=1 Tax=Folsomia candida TaxID=158441 RepID=UPI000B90951A|nr:probable elongation factor 1-beta [Folsomia candida]